MSWVSRSPGGSCPRDWARTAVKRLPERRSARLAGDLRADGADRPGPRLRQRPVHPAERPEPARIRPLRDRHPAGRDPLRHPACQSARPAQRSVRGQGRRDVPRALHGAGERRRDPPLPSPALSRPTPIASPRAHAAIPGRRPSRAGRRAACSSSRPIIPDYWAYMTPRLPRVLRLAEHPEPWPDAPDGRTRREILARGRGLAIFRGEASSPGRPHRRRRGRDGRPPPPAEVPQPGAMVGA